MSSYPPNSPYGLPRSPRPQQMLYPIDTSVGRRDSNNTNKRYDSGNSSPYTSNDSTPETCISEKNGMLIDNRQHSRETAIFANATIPLSPASSSSASNHGSDNDEVYFGEGVRPRKRNPFARLFCCFGKEERARRKADRWVVEYERPEDCHWTEY
ncbi:hypothetical protein BDV96DRAFT_594244 [Lophiotrema nucula]|uniref:Uncharacterized protein n=1 Tax=Lophiotrema nucula TaxID=690887 RepID=A0A6A5ZSY3_9PLEO|nr:hypothetical protein BDV96DRAFT_594244 [Lophiotrema nucula]